MGRLFACAVGLSLVAGVAACDEPARTGVASSRPSSIAAPLSPTPEPVAAEPKKVGPVDAKDRCQRLGPKPAGTVRVELWFEDFDFKMRGVQSWRAVVVHRDIPATDSITAAAVQAWMEGPTRSERSLGAHKTAPDGVALLGIDVEGSMAQVDMSEEIHYTHRGTCCEEVVLDTLIGTVTQFEGIERMQLWTDGKRANSFGDHGEFLEPEGREPYLGPRYLRRIPVCGDTA